MLKQKPERNAKRPISRPAIGPPIAGAPKYQQNSVQSTLVLGLVSNWKLDQKKKILRMEFKKFRNFFILLPCQIVKTGRRLVYRLLGWNEYLGVFFRAVETFRYPLRC